MMRLRRFLCGLAGWSIFMINTIHNQEADGTHA